MGYEIRENGICFYVSDTGTGIPEDKVSQVFERFTKLDAKRQGTGLGLSISRTIIKKMGGSRNVRWCRLIGSGISSKRTGI